MTHLHYRRRPRAWRYMLGALHAFPAWKEGRAFPALSARWEGYRPGTREIDHYTRLCGLPRATDTLPPLFVHAIAFRLQMALLTHRDFPVPIWRVLQVRNDLREHAAIARAAKLDFETRLLAHRVLAKGLEVDLHTTIAADGAPVAESINTFYVRGRYGGAADVDAAEAAPPAVEGAAIAAWRMRAGGGARFGALTGDYNGIHLFDGYARLSGFRRAFFHPLRVVVQALVHAGSAQAGPRRLRVWLRGPVFHDAQVELRRSGDVLGLFVQGDPRAAIVVQMGAQQAATGPTIAS
jgi:hypothetical protein